MMLAYRHSFYQSDCLDGCKCRMCNDFTYFSFNFIESVGIFYFIPQRIMKSSSLLCTRHKIGEEQSLWLVAAEGADAHQLSILEGLDRSPIKKHILTFTLQDHFFLPQKNSLDASPEKCVKVNWSWKGLTDKPSLFVFYFILKILSRTAIMACCEQTRVRVTPHCLPFARKD